MRKQQAAPARERSLAERLRGYVLVALVQAVLFFALLEVVGRLFDPVGVSYYNDTARMFDAMIIEEPIGYRFPPGLKGHFNGVPVEINEYGMRDRPVPEDKEPGEFRILAMGDSVIFSIGVRYEDSIPAQLERMANENASAGRRYRTLNMGVPSYNTVQELEQLRQVGLKLQPDVAFLYIIPNDLQDKMWVYDKRGSFLIDRAQRSYAVGLIFYSARWLVNQFGVSTNPNRELMFEEGPMDGGGLDAVESSLATAAEKTAARAANAARILENPAWLNIENSVLQINALLKTADVPLLVFYRPQFRSTYYGRLIDLGRSEGFSVHALDPFEDTRWADLKRSDYSNSPIDSHCNPAGCALYATLFYEALQEGGYLD